MIYFGMDVERLIDWFPISWNHVLKNFVFTLFGDAIFLYSKWFIIFSIVFVFGFKVIFALICHINVWLSKGKIYTLKCQKLENISKIILQNLYFFSKKVFLCIFFNFQFHISWKNVLKNFVFMLFWDVIFLCAKWFIVFSIKLKLFLH